MGHDYLGGERSNIHYFHLDFVGFHDPILTSAYFSKWVETQPPTRPGVVVCWFA